MKKNDIIEKFGSPLIVNDDTYILGIDVKLSDHLAYRFKDKIVIESCAGGGLTTINLAKYAQHVYTFEIDKNRCMDVKKNCRKMGIDNRVTIFNQSVYEINRMEIKDKINAAFLDPDWNNRIENYKYQFKNSMTQPASDELLKMTMKITKNITLVQPPFIDETEFSGLALHEFEQLYLNNELALYCLHFGTLKRRIGVTEFKV
jgi:16S rRNA G966 N2-methylase RsmD